jgi:hypothetical protein
VQVLKQPREDTRVRIYTPEHRIYGHMHLVPGRSTAELLSLEQREFVPITQVQLFSPGWTHPPQAHELRARLPFLGLSRTRILWVLGGRPTLVRGASFKEVRMTFVLPGYLVGGQLTIPSGARVSDYLYTARPFQSLSSATLSTLEEGMSLADAPPRARYDFVTVNLAQVMAVVEGDIPHQ